MSFPDELAASKAKLLLAMTRWEDTALGPRDQWSASLGTALDLTIHACFPMFVLWGRDFCCLYNDPIAGMIGKRHPSAWGKPFRDAWPEMWEIMHPRIEKTYRGEPCHVEDLPLYTNRNGRRERAWLSFTYAPLRDESGMIAGLHCTCFDTTNRINAARRNALRMRLFEKIRAQYSPQEIMLTSSHLLGKYLGASRVMFGDLHRDRGVIDFHSNYVDRHTAPVNGEREIADFGTENFAFCDRGTTWVNSDIRHDLRTSSAQILPNFQRIEVGACIVAPILRLRASTTSLFIHYRHPVQLTREEVAFVEDIAERVGLAIEQASALAALMAERNRSHRILNDMNEGFLLIDRQFRIQRLNPAGMKFYGLGAPPAVGTLLWNALPELENSPAGEFIRHANQESASGELRYRRAAGSGTEHWLELRATPDDEGLTIFLRDVTDSVLREAHMVYSATHDELTQLPNRAVLNDRLGHAIHKRAPGMLSVLYMDLDRFKHINDSLGHAVGDQLLKSIAERLAHSVRNGDTVARLGGDEFVVLLEDIGNLDEIATVAQKIRVLTAEPMTIERHEIRVSISIGASVFPQDGTDAATLLKHADVAMYHAKQGRPGGFRFFDAAMNARALEKLLIESALRAAIAENGFVVHYQPRIDSSNRQVVGLEALVRWQHPQKGLIPPSEFIALAQETGMVEQIDFLVLERVCLQLRDWRAEGRMPPPVSVNLSACHLQTGDLPARVGRLLKEIGIMPVLLEFEITEESLMRDMDAAIAQLREFKQMGISIAIDDFGVGHFSLSCLKKLPVETLKIDQSLIRDILDDPDDKAIVAATIALAESMKLEVIAEGVMHDTQVDLLSTMGCRLIQGFAYSAPLPPEAVMPFMDRFSGKRSGITSKTAEQPQLGA